MMDSMTMINNVPMNKVLAYGGEGAKPEPAKPKPAEAPKDAGKPAQK